MKNHHEVGHFKNRLMIGLLSLFAFTVLAGQSFAATSCSTCHGMPPLDSSDGSRIPSTGAFKGSHQSHLSGPALPADCVSCHSDAAATYEMSHSATAVATTGKNEINLTVGIYSKGAFFNQTSVPSSPLGTCSNVSCHANVYSSGTGTSPAWGSTGNGCGACHTVAIGPNGPDTGSHTSHAGSACTDCHAAGTSQTTKPSTGHIDETITVTNGYPVTAKHAADTYTGTCSTASCHANVYGSGSVPTPVWGNNTANCGACHTVAIGINGPDTGSHAAHAGKACTSCHAAGTAYDTAPLTGHKNNNIDVVLVGYTSVVVKHAAGTGYSTCSNASCHSNGKFTAAAATWGATLNCKGCHATLSVGHTPHISTLLDERANTLVYDRYSVNASSGSTYKFGCANCHPVNIAKHLDNFVDVDLTTTVGSGALKGKNGAASFNGSKQCFNVYCHSNGNTTTVYATTLVWGSTISGDKCAACHGNSPGASGQIAGSAAHNAHVVGIHYDDIFNGVSRKLPQGGGETVNAAHGRNNRSTTINCNVCHAATVSTSANDSNPVCAGCHNGTTAPLKNSGSLIANTANHVNGSVDISFVNSKIATKAQLAGSAFAGYTAANAGGWSRNSNGMSFKTYTSSYDVSKTTLLSSASWDQSTGCANVACHNGKSVKWTDTISCQDCHTRLK